MLNNNNKKLGQNTFKHKTKVAKKYIDVTDFDNIIYFFYLCILTQATIKCAFLKHKKVIVLLILSGSPNRFLNLKQYHSLEHAETKKYIFLFIYLLC